MKKALRIIFISLGILIVAILIAPFLFKGKILSLVRSEANKNLNAKVDFMDVDLSLIRSFPLFSIQIKGLQIAGIDSFATDTLLKVQHLRITTDIMSVIRGQAIAIKSIDIDEPRIHLKVLKSGLANWDITKPSADTEQKTESEPSAFQIALKKFAIRNGFMLYEDLQSNMLASIDRLNHESSGDLTADFTRLRTQTSIDSLSLKNTGIAYLSKAKLNYKADFDLDLKNSVYAFKENELQLNELLMKLDGKVEMPDSVVNMDIRFEAVKNEFRHFLSLIPGAYTSDFKDLKSSGTLALNGYVKGAYGDKVSPGFGLSLQIDNGMFQYPSLPRNVSGVMVRAAVECPSGIPDATVIDVPVMKATIGDAPVEARLNVRTPVSDAQIDAAAKGSLLLDAFKDLFPLEPGTTLGGRLQFDLTAKGRMSSIEKEAYQDFNLSGNLLASQMRYESKDLPQNILISNAQLNFSPRYIEMPDLQLRTGESDIQAKGRLENHLAYLFKDESIKGNLMLTSQKLNLNPFMQSSGSSTSSQPSEPAAESGGYIRLPGNVQFVLNARINQLIYDNLNISNLSGIMRIADQKLSMDNIIMQLLGGSLAMSGVYNTQSSNGPDMKFRLALKDFDIRETARTFNTIQKLAPIAENTVGRVSATFSMTANADQQMNLLYNTLFADGSFSTSAIVIEGFEMIKQTAAALKIDKLKKWQSEKMSAQFSIKEGKLFVEPFETRIGGYRTRIGGSNSIDQTINYALNIEIPKSDFGGAANAVLSDLTAKAAQRGVQVNVPDPVPVDVFVTGTFTSPKITTNLKQKGQDALSDLKAQAEQRAREEAERLKREAEERARAEADRLKQEAQGKAQQEAERARQEAERAKQEAERKAREEADKAKDKAKEELNNRIRGLGGKK